MHSPARNRYPLSHIQRNYFRQASAAGRSSVCLIGIPGLPDVRRLQEAFNRLVAKHEILRTSFEEEAGRLYQVVWPEWAGEVEDCTGQVYASAEAVAQSVQPAAFALGSLPLLRLKCFRIAGDASVLLLEKPALLTDRLSDVQLVAELERSYAGEATGEAPVQYVDFTLWQNDLGEDEAGRKIKHFWEDQLTVPVKPAELPADSLPAPGAVGFGTVAFTLDPALRRAIGSAAREHGLSPESFFLTVFYVVIGKFCRQEEVTVCCRVAGRSLEDASSIPGNFENALPLRKILKGTDAFGTLWKNIHQNLAVARKHQDIDVDSLLTGERTAGRTAEAVLNVGYDFFRLPKPPGASAWQVLPGLGGWNFGSARQPEMTLSLLENEPAGQLEALIQFRADKFHPDTLRSLWDAAEAVARRVILQPDVTLSRLPFLSPAGEQVLFSGYNPPPVDFGVAGPIHVLFAERARAFPDREAVIHQDRHLTYAALDGRSNQVAALLRHLGVRPATFVALHQERSFEVLTAMLAVLKAGGAFIPLDKDNPPARTRQLLENARAPVLFTDRAGLGNPVLFAAGGFLRSVVCLENLGDQKEAFGRRYGLAIFDLADVEAHAPAPLPNVNRLDDWAYMLYTSGTTGEPKGAITRHDGAINHIYAEFRDLALPDGFRFLQSAHISSDISIWQYLAPLLKGGAPVILDKEDLLNYESLLYVIGHHRITIVEFVPSFLTGFIEYLSSQAPHHPPLPALRWMMMVGEAVPVKLVNAWLRLYPHAAVLNGYGPCEASDDIAQCKFFAPLPASYQKAPIGRPLDNLTIVVLDEQMQLLPAGFVGEICVSGVGVGAGYWNNPVTTATSFVPNPFREALGEVMYKTGDLGRYRYDGLLEFWGRKDSQVKIRGFRVELGEIEAVLAGHEAVREAHLVLSENENGERDLVAFITVKDTNCYPLRNLLAYQQNNRQTAAPLYVLPNGLPVFHRNQAETDFCYDELFGGGTYRDALVHLRPGDVVFDVGANIGLFTLLVATTRPGCRLYAFEPLPPLSETLRENAALYDNAGIQVFDYGLADTETSHAFTYYPFNTMLSGMHGNPEADTAVVRATLQFQLLEQPETAGKGEDVEELLRQRMTHQSYPCRVRRLSDVMAELGIARIDLLKVDVEKSEMQVLRGIDEADWPKIGQVLIEVHDEAGRLAEVTGLLAQRGFAVATHQEEALENTNMYTLLATRHPAARPAETPAPARLWGTPQKLVADVKAYCAARLPEYSVPASIRIIDAIPVNLSDKVDKARLALLPGFTLEAETVSEPPVTATEQVLAGIWKQILNRETVGRQDNFFELGGQSLKAIAVTTYIQKLLCKKIPLREVFLRPELQQMAAFIDEQPPESFLPMRRVPEQDHYEVSSAQKRLFLMQQRDPHSVAYNISTALVIEGQADLARLENAFRMLALRHESLRTYFGYRAGEIVQRVAPSVYPVMARFTRAPGQSLAELIGSCIRPFDLQAAPLLRVAWLAETDERGVLVLDLHHSIADGISLDIIAEEMLRLYRGDSLEKLPYQYRDYVDWQGRLKKDAQYNRLRSYWVRQLGDRPALLDLPQAKLRPQSAQAAGAAIEFEIEAPLTRTLRQRAGEEGGTLYMVLLAALYGLLYKYSGQRQLLIGTPVSGRNHPGLDRSVGMYVNTVVLRGEVNAGESFAQLLGRVKNTVVNAIEHQDYQFEDLLEALNVELVPGRNPLFDVMFVMQTETDLGDDKSFPLRVFPYPIATGSARYDLAFNVTEKPECIQIRLDYNASLLDDAADIPRHYAAVLRQVAAHPSVLLRDVSLAAGPRRVVPPASSAPAGAKAFHQYLEDHAVARPEHPAVVFREKELSYAELDRQAGRVAHYLRQQGIERGQPVAIVAVPSLLLPVGVLGILKAGACFLPVDPETPPNRLTQVLSDSAAGLLLGPGGFVPGGELPCTFLDLDQFFERPADPPAAGVTKNPSDTTYVIYTSGSTGVPKGVQIADESLVNYSRWFAGELALTSRSQGILTSSFAFDLGYSSFFPVLWAGGTVHLLEKNDYLSAEHLLQYLAAQRITYLKLTPSFFSVLVNSARFSGAFLQHLEWIVLGGENIRPADVEKAHARAAHVRFMNHYGPTETTIGTCYHVIDFTAFEKFKAQPVIGKAIPNNQVSVLNHDLQEQPPGLPGLLYVSGKGVTKGYVGGSPHPPDKFTADPFSPGVTLYNTGDVGRYLPDGTIALIGRQDQQLKVRGFRVEVKEIEQTLLMLPDIRAVAVVGRAVAEAEKVLIAYLVSASEADPQELRRHVRKWLPAYMVPQYFIRLDQFPLTPNGKIDVAALPAPTLGAALPRQDSTPPGNPQEARMLDLWKTVLAADALGIHDNFFEVGGNSLKAIALMTAIHQCFARQVTLQDIFAHATIAALTARLDQAGEWAYEPVAPAPAGAEHPVSQSQKRLFVLQQKNTGSRSYNLFLAVMVSGHLELPRLQAAFNALVRRHEALRSSFKVSKGEIVQVTAAEVHLPVSSYALQSTDQLPETISAFRRPFDPGTAPLMRVGVVATGPASQLLMIELHHLVSDGISLEILMKEFVKLYRGENLLPLRVQYKDYVHWQDGRRQQGDFGRDEAYWLRQLSGQVPVLAFPTDYPRPLKQNFDGATVTLQLEEDLVGLLRKLAFQTGTTLNMVMLASVYTLLYKYTGQDDLLVGTPLSGRVHPDFGGLVGMFANTVVLRNRPAGNKPFAALLGEVRQTVLEAIEHQEYQFDDLVEKLHLKIDAARNPLFDVWFTYHSSEATDEPGLAGLDFRTFQVEDKQVMCDLHFDAWLQDNNRLVFRIDYDTSLFRAETIERLKAYYAQLLGRIARESHRSIQDLVQHTYRVPGIRPRAFTSSTP